MVRKRLLAALSGVAVLLASARANAAVSYVFEDTSLSAQPSAEFTLTVPDYITGAQSFGPGANLTTCVGSGFAFGSLTCARVDLFSSAVTTTSDSVAVYFTDNSFVKATFASGALRADGAYFQQQGLTAGSSLALLTVGRSTNANIAAAPEPAAWGFMLGGAAALGLLLRRRRTAALTV